MATLGELTAGIAHEIKNPLNFVTNFADVSHEMIQEAIHAESDEERGNILADLRINLGKIREHGHRADGIVRGMMLHARGAAGEMIETDVNELIETAINLAYHGMRASHPDRNVRIERTFAPSLPAILLLPPEISRVMLNLLNNALYAASSASPRRDQEGVVTVTTAQQDHHVEVRVRDNGPGVPAEIKDKIFQPFFTTKPAGEGTGLGLSMSYDIVVNGHGGSLTCESNGDGAEFIVQLPVKP